MKTVVVKFEETVALTEGLIQMLTNPEQYDTVNGGLEFSFLCEDEEEVEMLIEELDEVGVEFEVL